MSGEVKGSKPRSRRETETAPHARRGAGVNAPKSLISDPMPEDLDLGKAKRPETVAEA